MTVNVFDIENAVGDFGPVEITLGKTNVFSGEESGKPYDVVYVEIESDDLVRLNRLLKSKLPHQETQKSYKPHITLAYVKSGEGKKYSGIDLVQGMKVSFDELVFSNKKREKTKIDLTSEGMLSKDDQEERQMSQHDVSGEARASDGKWTSGGENFSKKPETAFPNAAEMKASVAEKLGIDPEIQKFAAHIASLPSSKRDEVNFNENHAGYQYYEAKKLMPKVENDTKFKKLTSGNNYTLSDEARFVANINGHPFLLNQWKDPDAKFKDDPKEFVWAFQPAGSRTFVETHTRENDELVSIIQKYIDNAILKSIPQQMSQSRNYQRGSSSHFQSHQSDLKLNEASDLQLIEAMRATGMDMTDLYMEAERSGVNPNDPEALKLFFQGVVVATERHARRNRNGDIR